MQPETAVNPLCLLLAHLIVQEIDVDLSMALAGSQALVRLSLWLGRAVVAARATLRSLRLSGPLHLGAVFQAMAPFAAQFTQLEVGWERGGCLASIVNFLGWREAAACPFLRGQMPGCARCPPWLPLLTRGGSTP